MRAAAIIFTLLLITGCSTKRPDDAWRYNTATAFKYAEQYFLEGKHSLAISEFSEAEKHAKQSADMMPLARLYLSKCALHKAVLLEDRCSDYLELSKIVTDASLSSYYAFLNDSLQADQVNNLPSQYRRFASARLERDAEAERDAIMSIEPFSSKIVAASLARTELNEEVIENILDEASHFGYKRAITAWMKELIKITSDPAKKERLQHKLTIIAGDTNSTP